MMQEANRPSCQPWCQDPVLSSHGGSEIWYRADRLNIHEKCSFGRWISQQSFSNGSLLRDRHSHWNIIESTRSATFMVVVLVPIPDGSIATSGVLWWIRKRHSSLALLNVAIFSVRCDVSSA